MQAGAEATPALEPSDEQLMERFRDGDARAFEVLVGRHGRAVYQFVLRYVSDGATAEDLVQEVFLRVVRSAPEYERRAKFTTWVYTIARNQCIDALRRRRYRRHPSLDAPMGDEDGPTLLETVAGDEPGSDRRAADTQFTGALDAALAALPDEQREVFLMREVHNLPFKEIAEITQVPTNTVKSRMRYALEALRHHLQEFDPT